MPKRSIRAQLLAERKSLSVEACAELSGVVQQRLIDSGALAAVGCVALYSSIHNEVFTGVVAAKALAAGVVVTFPRVQGDNLVFVEIADLSELSPGAFGVLEPQGERLVPCQDLDLVVVPGIAFDMTGHRLGYGRGFYDRALDDCRSSCVKVGLAYDFQLTDSLPTAAHDRTLSVLMTEKRTLNFTA